MTDDDIRDLLRTKAQEATVSADAWDKIAVRLAEPEHKVVSQLPRRLAAVGLAAAAVAGIVVLANRPDADPPVTQATTTSTATVRQVDPNFVRSVVEDWVHARVPGAVLGSLDQIVHDDGRVTVRLTGGDLDTELHLVPTNGGQGLEVASATSALVLIQNPTYDGHDLVAEAVPAVEGRMTTTYVVDGESHPGGTLPVTHEAPALGWQVEGARAVVVRVVLVTPDGMTGIAEEAARVVRDPATATGSYVALFPSTDSVGLAAMQEQADNHRRDDLLDPVGVAGNALYELLPRSETSTTYTLGDFRAVDGYRGEVPYTLSDGGTGVVQLNRTEPNDKTRIWYVTGVTSDALEVLGYHHEGRALVIDVRATVAGTLTLAGGDAPIDVQPGLQTHVSRPLGRDIQTGAPVELRLRSDRKTLAVLAQLPR